MSGRTAHCLSSSIALRIVPTVSLFLLCDLEKKFLRRGVL